MIVSCSILIIFINSASSTMRRISCLVRIIVYKYILKSEMDRWFPWRIPERMWTWKCLIICIRWDRNDWNQNSKEREKPKDYTCNFFTRIRWFVQFKALENSVWTISVCELKLKDWRIIFLVSDKIYILYII